MQKRAKRKEGRMADGRAMIIRARKEYVKREWKSRKRWNGGDGNGTRWRGTDGDGLDDRPGGGSVQPAGDPEEPGRENELTPEQSGNDYRSDSG